MGFVSASAHMAHAVDTDGFMPPGFPRRVVSELGLTLADVAAVAGIAGLPLAAAGLYLQWARTHPRLLVEVRDYSYGFTSERTDVNLRLRVVNRGGRETRIESAHLRVSETPATFSVLAAETSPPLESVRLAPGDNIQWTLSFRAPGGHRLDRKVSLLSLRLTRGGKAEVGFLFQRPVTSWRGFRWRGRRKARAQSGVQAS